MFHEGRRRSAYLWVDRRLGDDPGFMNRVSVLTKPPKPPKPKPEEKKEEKKPRPLNVLEEAISREVEKLIEARLQEERSRQQEEHSRLVTMLLEQQEKIREQGEKLCGLEEDMEKTVSILRALLPDS